MSEFVLVKRKIKLHKEQIGINRKCTKVCKNVQKCAKVLKNVPSYCRIMSKDKYVCTTICVRIRTTHKVFLKKMGGVDVFVKRKRSKKRRLGEITKEEDTMAATARNFVYEVKAKEGKKILAQPAASKSFLEDCKKVAQKYRRKG